MLQMAEFPSFLRLNNVPLYVYSTFPLILHQSIDASMSWLLWIILQWLLECRILSKLNHIICSLLCLVALGGSEVKASACNVGDLGSIPGSGSSPGEGNGNPLQYSCLENPMDRGAWWATVHGVAKSQAWLSDLTYLMF